MTLQQISSILNNSIAPLILGEGATISPTLDNLTDLGTAIENATADQLKDYTRRFVAGVARTMFDTRDYNPPALPIRIDSQEYGGVVQSVKVDFTESRDSAIYSLVDGTVYSDVNKYFGTAVNNKVYERDNGWSYVISIPKEKFKKSFTSAQGVQELTNTIRMRIKRTMARDENALQHNLISSLIKNAIVDSQGDSREIKLVTAYNALVNAENSIVTGTAITGTNGENEVDLVSGQATPVTAENCLYNEHFRKWATTVIKSVIDNAQYAGKKYNDGTINAWLGSDKTVLFIGQFADMMEQGTLPEHTRVSFWNYNPTTVIPSLADVTKVVYNTGAVSEGGDPWDITDLSANNNLTINNVIGIVFDRYAVGYTVTPLDAETSYNEQGRFFNVWEEINHREYIDTRNVSIVFTLN